MELKIKTALVMLLILIATLLTFSLIQTAFSQTSSGTKVAVTPASTSALLGKPITINITISNVQNLYGVDVTLFWDPSALAIQNVDLRLGVESHPDGVLHEAGADIFIQKNDVDQANGEYDLVATSVSPAPSFSGSGNIVSITFNVTAVGRSDLILATDLGDYNPSGGNQIDHTDVNGSVDSVIPEFPSATAISLVLILVITTIVLSKRLLGKTYSKPKSISALQ
jgi:hypothetical protein